jgi:hypothetical protein
MKKNLVFMVMLMTLMACGVAGCGSDGSDGSNGGKNATGQAGNDYFPSATGFSWTYDVTSSTGSSYTSTATVLSSSRTGFSVKSQNSNASTYGLTDYIFDGTALKYASTSSYAADGTLSSKTEHTPAALVLPSSMANTTTETTVSIDKTTSGATVTTASVTRSVNINGEENVTTPAGTFTAKKLTLSMTSYSSTGGAPTVTVSTYWYVKNIGRVKLELKSVVGGIATTTTMLLKSYSPPTAALDIDSGR